MLYFLIARENLTAEQLRAVELNCDEHRLIAGGPGSGKTIIILHRARYLIDKYKIDYRRYRIFVFTKVLKEYIKSSLDLLGLFEGCVTTFDSWCFDFYKRNIDRYLPKLEGGVPDFSKIRLGVRNHLQQPFVSPIFDFVLIDEGQDLDTVAYDILKKLSKHISVFIDHKQQVYENGTTEEEILNLLGLRKRSVGLLETYRCCPFIVRLASTFITDKSEKEAYTNQTRIAQTEKETPLLYIAAHFDDEMESLAAVIRARQNLGERIAILVPQKKLAYGIAKGLGEVGIRVEIPRKFKNDEHSFDFFGPYPKIMPYPSAKGLTFDSILLPRLLPRFFGCSTDDRACKLMFVAITRATKWVYMSTVKGVEFKFMREAIALGKTSELTIRRNNIEPDLFSQQNDQVEEKFNKINVSDVADFF